MSNTSPTNDNGVPLSILAYNPKAASINTQLGLGYLQQGEIERAKTKLLMAQKQDPHSGEVMIGLAYYYDVIGNTKEADRYYRKAYSLATEKGDAANNYGVFLCKQKDYVNANKYFEKAINDPNYVRTPQTYENMGLCSLAKDDIPTAKMYFEKALRIDPRLSNSLLQMAEISVKARDWNAAQHYLTYYKATGDKSPDALWLAIQTAQALGDKNKVMSLGLQLKELYPNSAQYHQYQVATRGAA